MNRWLGGAKKFGDALAILAALAVVSEAHGDQDSESEKRWTAEHLKHGRPEPSAAEQVVIVREGYALGYDSARRIPLWVAYRLDPLDAILPLKPRRPPGPDPRIAGPQARAEDYASSDYVAGRLAPLEDMRASRKVMDEAAFLSLTAPRDPVFDRGTWAKLAAQTRQWLPRRKQLWIYAGPVLEDDETGETIGSGVAVPTHFWKVVIDEREDGTLSAVGFLMPNSADCPPFDKCVATIDAIESATGLDLLPGVDETIQALTEGRVIAEHWRPPAPKVKKQAYLPRTPQRPRLRITREGSSGSRSRARSSSGKTSRRLRRGQQITFRGLRLRLTRVIENDPNDSLDDEVRLSAVTGTDSQTLILRELGTIFFDDYSITADRIDPSGASGNGRALLVIEKHGR